MNTLLLAARFVLALGLSLAMAEPAAAITTESGTVCKPAGTAGDIAWSQFGVNNDSSVTQDIVCPIVRVQEPGSRGFAVYLDGYVPRGATTMCTIYSMDFGGHVIGSAPISVAGPSAFDESVLLLQWQVPPWSSQSVRCSLPPGGVLFDVEPYYP